jgi:phospholipase A1
MRNTFRTALANLFLLIACPVFAVAESATLADCANILDNDKRLECFDRLAAVSRGKGGEAQDFARTQPPATPDAAAKADVKTEQPARYSLADHWELGKANKRGTFSFRPHRENYVLATYNHAPNDAPYRPFRNLVPEAQNLSHAELAYQLGFKMKLLENPWDNPVDLWFGYTQQSFWQAYNHEASSPFRETNYQPELMAVVPVDLKLLGMNTRFINLGLVHQSNGQTSTLSRSWNRLYAQVGMERGNFTLLARIWKRLKESDDDNPDIVDYMGRGDIAGIYRWEGHELFAFTRYNFHTSKGAVQLGWAFPLAANLKGYVQVFSGYGQSLIDYNDSQKTIGLGFLVNY